MIVTFTVEPEAIIEAGRDVLTHRRVIKIWKNHGVLLHDGANPSNPRSSSLGRAVAELPTATKVLWQKAFTKEKTAQAESGWSLNEGGTFEQELKAISPTLMCVT